MRQILKPEDVDWEKAKEIVRKEKPTWYEDYDEAEGLFMGWRYKGKSQHHVPFKEFSRWWRKRNAKK